MSLLSELKNDLSALGIPVETVAMTDKAPERYIVLTPLADTFDLHADNLPGVEIQEVRVSIFTNGSYTAAKKQLVRILLNGDYTITDRRYNGYETDTGYHLYTVDVAKFYETEE